MKLNGKSVVVTGASSGMGKAIVERFAREGANIIAVARRKERLDELALSLKDAPGKVVPFIGDVKNEKIDQVFAVNIYGPMYSMRKAVQVFLEQGDGGNIINVASFGALRTAAGAVYGASKAALVSLSKNTAYMYMPNGIRCNVIAPGGIVTEISSSMGIPNMNGYSRIKNVMATAPAPGSPEQIASAALFLASDESSYVNGDVLLVDGGWAAG